MIVHALRRKRRREDGAALVEFALILPVLVLLLFGLIDFGFIYNDFLSLRQGVRDGARQGAVAAFGTTTNCNNASFTGAITSVQAKELICVTRNRIGLTDAKMRVGVCLAPTPTTPAASLVNNGQCSSRTADYASPGNTMIVCGMYPAVSRTGFLKNFVNGVVTTRVAIRIEQTAYAAGGGVGANTDDFATGLEDVTATSSFPGKTWDFCKP